jgi:L-fuconolactonase
MIIDSHQHFWKYNSARHAWIGDDMKVIQRDFMPADLHPLLIENKIDGCVAVQVDQNEKETHFLLELADQHAFIKGVIGWIDLCASNVEERLAYFKQFPRLKGFRHLVQGEPKGFLGNPSFVNGVQKLQQYNFTYDLLIYDHQLDEALAFAHQVQNVRMVVDHLAKPSIRKGEKTRWELNMAALATFQNVYCKISGMVTEANWTAWEGKDFEPYLDEVFEFFGPDRLMYGSDWPVCLVAASYKQQLHIVDQYTSRLSASEKQKVFGDNAKRFYNLE